MIALLIPLLLAEAQPTAVRIETTERGDELRVKLRADGWSQACPLPVTFERPCEVLGAPTGIVHLAATGSRRLDTSFLLWRSPSVVRLEHQGFDRALIGLGLVAVAVAAIAGGVALVDNRRPDGGRVLVGLGVAIETAGLALIISDVTRTHDRAVVTH
jgi:hypothetical protein